MNHLKNDPFKGTFDSLEEFADMISEVVQCPITIEDANHRLLAYSTHDERTDPARISTIIGRRVPEKVINQLWKEGTIPTLLKTKEPVRVKNIEDIGLGNRVAISIWKNDEILGFIWALEVDKTLTDLDYLLLKKAAEAAKNKLLQLQTRKNKKEERIQEFFWKLLTGHLKENEDIFENFHSLNITPPPSFGVVVIQFNDNITSNLEKQISYLIKTNQLQKVILHTIDCNQLILLISLNNLEKPQDEIDQFAKAFLQRLKDHFGTIAIRTSIGSSFQDFRKIRKSYQEALTVLSVKEKFPVETENIFHYQKLGIYQLMDLLFEKRQHEEYENYSLRKLHEYDQKYHSNLAETLEIFLNKDSNVADAAKVLNVHINTLNYRLKRISEIGDINFKDINQKMILYLDLKLEKFK